MDELNYIDLALIEKIDESTILEKFGMAINSSFFDAANLLGTLKQKGYIEILPQFPGPTKIVVTQKGSELVGMALSKADQEIERLDDAIISLIANGYREADAIASKLNLRSSDVALHIYRIVHQGFVVSTFKSGKVELSLTDAGFVRAGYPPVGTPDDMKKESEEVEALLEDEEPAPVESQPEEGPVKITSSRKLGNADRLIAKAEYYVIKFAKYLLIGIALLFLLILAVMVFITLKLI